MSFTEEKFETLIKPVAGLTECHKNSQQQLIEKLKKLKQDVITVQEDVTERAIKQAKQERSYECQKNSHQE